jgi:hypothetical protein
MRLIKNRQIVQEENRSPDHLDLSKAERVLMPNLNFSTETISLRTLFALLNVIRREANRNSIPYQSFIKLSLAEKFG